MVNECSRRTFRHTIAVVDDVFGSLCAAGHPLPVYDSVVDHAFNVIDYLISSARLSSQKQSTRLSVLLVLAL
jgi:hypothetical protein